MKKEYVKPAAQVEELIVEGSMLTSSPGDEHIEINPGQGGGADANAHRGTWGNFWD